MQQAERSLLALQVGFIGTGRLARALAWMLQQQGLSVTRVASHRLESARALAASLSACQAVVAQKVADDCDLVFIATPDGTIAEVAASLVWRAGQAVVHCSGATPVSVLEPASQAGAVIGGFHPMQSFGADVQAACDSLPGCTVAIEAADDILAQWLDLLAARLGCVPLRLPEGARARYHAAGGYASQHVYVLLGEAVRLWQSWGASEREALDALLPLLRGTVESLKHSGLAAGMPGPVSRGDSGTIRRHRQALEAVDPEMRDLYDRLCTRGVALIRQSGRLDDAAVQRMLAALHEKPPAD